MIFAVLSFAASSLLGPTKKPSAAKLAPYECGIVPDREPPTRFPVRFYLVAMIFIIFDIEIVFLYPFAVIFKQLHTFGLVEVLVFAVVVLVSSAMLAPRKKPSAAKLAPYECGIVPDVEPPQRFPVRFYLVSMIFIIFDIEIVFLLSLIHI